nr:phage tail spike protein [uncultured Romboutsia sp.]
MIPRIYDNSFTTYDSNGLGLLVDAISCQVEEESNGDFELTLVYPSEGSFFYALKQDNIIKVDASDILKGQLFRIDTISKPLNGQVTVYAKHITFDLAKNSLNEDLTEKNIKCENAGKHMLQKSDADSRFSVESNIEMLGNYSMDRKTDCLSAIAGAKGSLIDTFGNGPKLLRDNFTISVLNRRGKDDNTLIAYKKNITGFTLEEDYSEIINVIKPYATYTEDEVEKTLYIDEIGVKSPRYIEGDIVKSRWIDFSDKFDEDETPTKEKLKNLAEKYFNDNSCDLPKMTYKIEFQPLSQTEEYKEDGLAELEYIGMDDSVYIANSKYGIRDQARVIKTTYNVLADKYISIELGDPKTTLGSIINKSNNSTVTKDEVKDLINKNNKKDYPNTLPIVPVVTIDRAGFKTISLSWQYENKPYYFYEVYASQEQGFTPNTFDLIFKGQASAFLHEVECAQTWYYKVRAINTYGNATDFSKVVSATTTKISDAAEYFQEAAIESALIGSLNADVINAGKLKGTYIDARNINVIDGNGNTTFSINSAGEVSLVEGDISIDKNGIQVYHKSQDDSPVGTTVVDEEGFRILDKDGNELADIGAQGAHFANLTVDGKLNHYPSVQIIDRQQGWTKDYYVGKIATGDGSGRDEANKADSLQTVLRNLKEDGCMFFNAIYIKLEEGVRVREKIVLQDFYGTLLQINLGKDALLQVKEGSVIEDTRCRIYITSSEYNGTDTLDSYNESGKLNSSLGCVEIKDVAGLKLSHNSHVRFDGLRIRGNTTDSVGFRCADSNLLEVTNCDISKLDKIADGYNSSKILLVNCQGNVNKLATLASGSIFSSSIQVPSYTETEPCEVYGSSAVVNSFETYVKKDSQFQDTFSNDDNTNTLAIFGVSQQYTNYEGDGVNEETSMLNLVGQGKFRDDYKYMHGYAVFINDTDDSMGDYLKTLENYNMYLRMTRADNNTTAPIPRVRFQLGNGEYTAYYKLDPLTSPLTGDGSGAQIIDYNATEDRKLPKDLADKIATYGVYSVEFLSDEVENYLVVDNIKLVVVGTAKGEESGDIGTDVKAIGKILANALNVRKTPGTDGEYAGLLVNGDTVEIVGVDSTTGWYKIKFEGGYGWVTNKSEYVEIISGDPNGTITQKVEVLADNLNVRSGPGTSNSSIGIVSKGFVADILETDKDTGWYKISYNGEYGWVTNNTTYVKVTTGTATVSPELYDGAKVAGFAETYYNARNNYTSAKSWDNGFTYGDSTPCNTSASGTQGATNSIWEKSSQGNYWKMIDESTLILLCLMGYSYTDSPYSSLVNFNNYRTNIMAKNSAYAGAIVPTNGSNIARTCAEIAQYFYNKGQTFTVKSDYSNLQKGDLLFYARKTSSGAYVYPTRWKYISTGAICIGQDTDGNAQLITAMSNPGEKHTDGWFVGLKKDLVKNQQPSTIVLAVRPSTKVTSSGGSSSGGTSGGTNTVVSDLRKTICDTAMKIVNMGTNHTAWYSQYWRTTSLSSMVTIKGKVETVGGTTYYQPSWVQVGVTYGFDCSSLVGCCYEKAGMGYMKGLTCSMGTLQSTAKAHGATFWRYADSGFTRAKPGDIIMFANDGYTVTTSNMAKVRTHHTAIYMGNGYIAEASGYKKGIIYSKYNLSKQAFFIRLPELDKADSASSTGGTTVKEEYVNCFNEKGTIDGKNYIYRLHDARCTCYAATESNSSGRSGLGTHMGKTVAAQNIPYGTKIYIPGLKGQTWTNANGTKVTLDGIFTVTDSGIAMFDFDIVAGSTSNACYSNYANPARFEVYILEWGTSSIQNYSFTDTWRIAYNGGRLTRYKAAFKNYISNGGVLINLLKFYNDDANIRSSTYWNVLNS